MKQKILLWSGAILSLFITLAGSAAIYLYKKQREWNVEYERKMTAISIRFRDDSLRLESDLEKELKKYPYIDLDKTSLTFLDGGSDLSRRTKEEVIAIFPPGKYLRFHTCMITMLSDLQIDLNTMACSIRSRDEIKFSQDYQRAQKNYLRDRENLKYEASRLDPPSRRALEVMIRALERKLSNQFPSKKSSNKSLP